ncbi:hypothetical protein DFA_12220 [Cavenderia fasciculata]|uniref:Ankyrin repeat-containing protein n=1 Tax=Cavenderia fasciculata TaxID=261658 RepID=F4QCM0_CACFS|nr:uncharacterized protein DFA_12220 [Cavenderia fasciculata]EGG14448.1 hypothetical protein DFA_12220 [Cavenderia fasciculata]|eukprot:XP_004353857.1 hypothetical protein DFA_12220 [Cavenderia fasciculata]
MIFDQKRKMTTTKELLLHIYRNRFLIDTIKHHNRSDQQRRDVGCCIERISRYDHWYTAEQMLSNKHDQQAHTNLLIDKLKRGIHVPFTEKSIAMICRRVDDLEQFKYLYQVKRNSFLGGDLVQSACKAGNLQIIKLLLDQEHPIKLSTEGSYLSALKHGHQHVLQFLIDHRIMFPIDEMTSQFKLVPISFGMIKAAKWLKANYRSTSIEYNQYLDSLELALDDFLVRHPHQLNNLSYINRYLKGKMMLQGLGITEMLELEMEDQQIHIEKTMDAMNTGTNAFTSYRIFKHVRLEDLPTVIQMFSGEREQAMEYAMMREDSDAVSVIMLMRDNDYPIPLNSFTPYTIKSEQVCYTRTTRRTL